MQAIAFYDLNDPAIPSGRPAHKTSGIPPVGKDQFQSPESSAQTFHQQHAAVAVLNVGGMNDQLDDQPQRVDQDMSLASLDFLARIISTVPPFSAVFTDWLSMMPAEGVGFFPAFRRSWARRRS